jgi:hypothetical protein
LRFYSLAGNISNSKFINVAPIGGSLFYQNCDISYTDSELIAVSSYFIPGIILGKFGAIIMRNVSIRASGLIKFTIFFLQNYDYFSGRYFEINCILINLTIDGVYEATLFNFYFQIDPSYSESFKSSMISIGDSVIKNCQSANFFYISSYSIRPGNENIEVQMDLENTFFFRNFNLNFRQSRISNFILPQLSFLLCLMKDNIDLLVTDNGLFGFSINQSVFENNVNSQKTMVEFSPKLGSIQNSLFISNICSFCSMLMVRT